MSGSRVQEMPSGPEVELFHRFRRELTDLLRDEQPVTLRISAVQAWAALTNLHLALRHPQNVGPTAEWARQVASALEGVIAPPGTARAELVRRAKGGG